MPAKRKALEVASRKQTKALSSATEINYRSIFENAGEGIYQTTPNGKFLAANPAMARILGFNSPEELIRERTDIARQSYVDPKKREEFKKLLERNDFVSGFECEVYRKDGSTVWVSETARAIRDAGGKILFYEGFLEDITGRKRSEETLRKNEAHLKLAQQVAHFGSWELELKNLDDINSNHLFWSDETFRIFGFEPGSGEMTNELFFKAVHPDDRAVIKAVVSKALAEKKRYAIDHRIIFPNGEVRHVHEEANIVFDEKTGKPLKWAGTVMDITERKEAEALRNGQSQILEMIATSAPLDKILTRLVHLIESQAGGMLCSVLLLGKDGQHLRHGAAPSLPENYNKLVDGLCIGPKAGSCGTAVHRKKTVIVSDITTDPLWADYRDVATQYGFRACWSTPILSQGDKVLGTFAMYYREPRSPRGMERRLIEVATQIAGVAITRRRTEEALLESQALYHSFVEHLPAGVFRKDYEGRFVFVNSMFCKLKGQKAEEILGKTPAELAAFEAASEHTKTLRHPTLLRGVGDHELMMRTGKSIELEEVYPQPDGTVEYFYVVKSPVFGSDGRVIGSQGIQFDITARKLAEKELFKSQQMLLTILDTVPQRVFWKDKNSVYVGCNKSLAQDCGYNDPSELIGKDDFATKSAPTAEMYRADDRDVMETRRAKLNFEEPQVRADGSNGWLRTSKAPLFDKDGNVIGVLGIYEDITELKGLEEQLRQAQKMDAFGQLAAGVAHDFNNILTVIQGNLSLLRTGVDFKADKISNIEQALAACDRAANLTRQLLTFGRRQPMQPKALDLNDVVSNMTKMLQRLIGEHIALEAHYAPGGAPVFVDVNMLEQVLVNLAVNSRDAMLKGGKLVVEINSVTLGENEVQRKNKKAGDFVRLSVTDNGTGIAPKDLPHIFEPFFTTKEVGKGTGLGLATVFGIVQQHDGWIKVESEAGEGTTFHVFLPRLAKNISVISENASTAKVRGGNENILLVEDELPVRELMRMLLMRSGYKIHEATSGADALKLWSELRDKIDLLLTDMVMPDGVSGQELAEKLRMEKPALKVIYCSGYSDEMLGENSPLRGNSNFLEKPFEPKKLLQLVRDCLDGQ